MKILLDTHIWIWFLAGSSNLPTQFKELLENKRNEVWLSPISVWEALVLAEKNKISVMYDSKLFTREAFLLWPVKEAPLNFEVALKSKEINLPHKDPADRFIAATALVYGLRLMTVDKRLLSATWLHTIDLL
jgi:PIN domain nuclease of toxin-antitoxin system